MANGAVLNLLFMLGIFQKGVTALIETQQTVMAAVGEEALLYCHLTQPKDVVQVTWQKVSPERIENVATYAEGFGETVDPDFRDKVEFKAAGLQNSSIVIKKVTEQDEGCYHCLFSCYPEGALTATTCLKLYELHEPILHVRESNSPEETVVSCWATGRPAPTVTLRVLKQDVHLSNYSSVSVTNTNATVTVTATAVLSGFHDSSTQVGCAARVLSAPQIEVFMMIPQVKLSSDDGLHETSGSHVLRSCFIWIIVSVSVVALVCVTAIIIIRVEHKQKHHNSLSNRIYDEIQTPQKTKEHAHEIKTPSIHQENEQVRLRPSVEKNKETDQKASYFTARCQRRLFFTNMNYVVTQNPTRLWWQNENWL